MTTDVDLELVALRGQNPLALFAALGALDVARRCLMDRRVTLRWTDSLEPLAVLRGPDSMAHLVDLCDEDRQHWARSPVLTWGPDGVPLDDLKTTPDGLRAWVETVARSVSGGDGRPRGRGRADIDLLAALVAEGALAGKGDTKPTHFHFTAGQQRFLAMVRDLQAGVDAERISEALVGPWRYDSKLPSLGWDARGERIYALRGTNPATEKRLSVPGADWLGFLGLRFFPVSVNSGQLLTAGCSANWKSGTFTWPLWNVDLPGSVVASLLTDGTLSRMRVSARRKLGIHHLLRAPIRRSDQGGYGSFGSPEPVFV